MPPAHTDGDSILYFENANVLHMGDLYFNGRYPFIDLRSGGDVDGYIAAGRRVIEIANESTKIIPGHGKLSNEKELGAWLDLLEGYAKQVRAMVADGKTWKEISDAGITKQTLYEIDKSQFTRQTYERAMEALNAVNGEILGLVQEAWGRTPKES